MNWFRVYGASYEQALGIPWRRMSRTPYLNHRRIR